MKTSLEEKKEKREILLVGPYGVLGTGVIDAAANTNFTITTAARRPIPNYRTQNAPKHINVDLLDREATFKAFSTLDTVTDLVFAAYVEKPTMAETVAPNAKMLQNTLDALAARNVPLKRIMLSGGAKSYGFSLGSFNAPAKESEPRLIAPIHYHQQEDIVADWSVKYGANWTVLRPHLVMGPSLNSPMNIVTSLATYAAMHRELGLPLRFPGSKAGWNSLQETTDAELFGRATLWSLTEDKARNEIFNISNGDVFRWRQLWTELAKFYHLEIAEPLGMSTVSEMSEKAPLWEAMVIKYGLHLTPYEQIANWAFVDYMLNFSDETIQSTIKIRQAGFGESIDTHVSFTRQLTRLRDLKIIP
ncbi:NAD-dependent dehydratase [Dyadobacter frigoris]|uniref:SDR family oxidoreductase n=1 Tax=Dyadobacter frigoris TaxID=2576211 RepID=UPI0024A53A4E|nr:SDR family oxidoreductase [Dyadobacter frigoris]GLU55231.1 NAD-dependent dehydratase [Dyadobacter frigoris]